jgi:hypothetical protein
VEGFGETHFYIPSSQKRLVYGGFGGVALELLVSKRYSKLSGGLFDSLREGCWLLDYYVGRLQHFRHLKQFATMVGKHFEGIKLLPPYLRPKYFTAFLYRLIV